MKNLTHLSLAALCVLALTSCGKSVQCESVEIVPRPLEISTYDNPPFELKANTKLVVPPDFEVLPTETDDERSMYYVMNAIKELTQQVFGKEIPLSEQAVKQNFVQLKSDPDLEEEAYLINVRSEGIILTASTARGFYYAVQSLRQMIPAEAFTDMKVKSIVIPSLTIVDKPAFAYRGTMLDVCRHFFTVDEVKQYLDILAFHKINRFHFHLTEDQGWRIEIKQYPKLTEVGAWRDSTMVGKNWNEFDGTRHGGFYTQDEIRDIVQYAAERFITVIPEIEIPGHARAALASYPELGCRGEGYTVSSTWGVFPQVFCPGKEETFTFWQNVLTEVMDLFPSKYIHIGGDECPKSEWQQCPLCQQRIQEEGLANEAELQSYVTSRVEAFLNEHGRSIIGWDEILEGGVTPTATVMSWRGVNGGIAAAKAGNNVIMTPTGYCYLDYYQSKDTAEEPLAIGGYVPVEKSYSFDPYAGLTEEEQQCILGVQGNLWTEYISTLDYAEYMLLPRMSALAEVAWSYGNKDYADFLSRMNHTATYFDLYGWNYGKHIFEAPAETAE